MFKNDIKNNIQIPYVDLPNIGFNDIEFKKDHALGQVLLIGRSEGNDLEKIELIHRIGIFKNVLFSGEFIDDGLFLEGVNRIEMHQTIRLINVNNPKVAL